MNIRVENNKMIVEAAPLEGALMANAVLMTLAVLNQHAEGCERALDAIQRIIHDMTGGDIDDAREWLYQNGRLIGEVGMTAPWEPEEKKWDEGINWKEGGWDA